MITFTVELDMQDAQDMIYELPDVEAVNEIMEQIAETARRFRYPKITGGAVLCMAFDLICEMCDLDKAEMLKTMNKIIPEVNRKMGDMFMEERQ